MNEETWIIITFDKYLYQTSLRSRTEGLVRYISVKVSIAQPADQSLIPRVHTMEGQSPVL